VQEFSDSCPEGELAGSPQSTMITGRNLKSAPGLTHLPICE
jgi:hypothetical protein